MTEHRRPGVRVMVAGVGAVTPMGPTAADLWEGVKSGRVAIGPVTRLRLSDQPVSIGGQVPDDAPFRVAPAGATGPDRALQLALVAADEALRQSRITHAQVAAGRWAVVIASCRPGLSVRWEPDGRDEPPRVAFDLMPQALAEQLSAAFGLTGPVVAIDSACAGSTIALGYAADLILSGHADAALAGGTEILSDLAFAGFNSLEALSTRPAAPYARDRDGLNLAEGSAMLVLVRHDVLVEAAVPPLAEVLGHGLSADGFHPTAPQPEGEGASRAIRAALDAAKVGPRDVDYINAHGTGTPKNDTAETKAIRRALGDAADSVPVSSTKSMIGHLLGAAGAVEAVVTTLALQEQVIPPTANLTEPDPECDLDYVSEGARPARLDVAVSNGFGFGGTNACLVLGRPGNGNNRRGRSVAPERIVVTGMFSELGPKSWPAAARLDPDSSDVLTSKQRRRLDRLSVFGVIAAGRALQDAGVSLDGATGTDVGLVFATALGPHEASSEFLWPVVREGARAANPAVFPNVVRSAAAGCIATHLHTLGPMLSVVAGHAAGAVAMAYAADLLRATRAQAMVMVAADTLSDAALEAYRDLRTVDDAAPPHLAESLAGVVLEPLSQARNRGAHIYGEVLGHGLACDGRHLGIAIERAMSEALSQAGRKPSEVTAVWSAAAGFPAIDGPEAVAIRRLLGDDTSVVTPKMELGEPLAAGGPLLCSLALRELAGPGDRGASGSERATILVNAISVGGSAACIALGEPPASTVH